MVNSKTKSIVLAGFLALAIAAAGAFGYMGRSKAMALEAVTITPDTDAFDMTVGAGQNFTADLALTGCYVITLTGEIYDESTVITAEYGGKVTQYTKVTQFTWYNLYTSAIVADASDTTITFTSNSATAVELTAYLMPLSTANSAVLVPNPLQSTSVTVEGFSFVPYTIADAGAYTITVTLPEDDYLMVIGPTYEIVRSVENEEVTFTFTTPAANSLIIFGNKDFANNTFEITLEKQ